MQLVIPLARGGEPLFRQVYSGLRQAILAGSLRPGDRLPSTRDLAEQLRISRTVVLLAYEQLLAEGFAAGRGGSGTYVSEGFAGRPVRGKKGPARLRLSRFGSAVAGSMPTVDTPQLPRTAPPWNFIYGRSDLETFPFAMWRRLLLRQARRASVRQFDYGSALGDWDLRVAICAHLRRSRAVVCDPSEVIVVNGSQQALDLVIRVLVQPGDGVALEDPHYDGAREAFRAAGARLRPVPVDRDGLDPTFLPDDAVLAFVTHPISSRPGRSCRWSAGSSFSSGPDGATRSSSRTTTTGNSGMRGARSNPCRDWTRRDASSISGRFPAPSFPPCALATSSPRNRCSPPSPRPSG